jgi:hypothetical protein
MLQLTVADTEHVYICGTAQDEHLSSNAPTSFHAHDTIVVFLQSKVGAQRWPVTKAGLDALGHAFRTSASTTRVTRPAVGDLE